MELFNGFSKLSTEEKILAISKLFDNQKEIFQYLKSFHHSDKDVQELFEGFSENTISNFHMPFSVAPNFLINGKNYMVPMVIEESSVVAAASKSAKFWFNKGGFQTEIVSTEKIGQVHVLWHDSVDLLKFKFSELKNELIEDTNSITENMRKRGGGILNIELKDFTDQEPGMMQIYCTFDTRDSMGANFINSCLEQFAATFKNWYSRQAEFSGHGLDIILCILSNLTPNCRVKCWVETDVKNFDGIVKDIRGEDFVERFALGVRVAEVDPHRAVTHNKGVFNGVDAVVLATGNDFRAVEACGHAYASRSGKYSPLTKVDLKDDHFKFTLDLPISIGVVGGLTKLHPLVKFSLKMLGNPTATELMGIAAAVGLANNFSAVKSLVTTGIQKGHMKMHLINIMNQLEVPKEYRDRIIEYFKTHKVSVSEVRKVCDELKYTGKIKGSVKI